MDKTQAERQARWRAKREAEGKKQLVVMVSVEAHEVIEKINNATGENKASIVERAILQLNQPADLFSQATPNPVEEPITGKEAILALIQRLREKEQRSYQSIADELNQRQIPTLSGKGKWHGKTVQKIIKTA